MVIKGDGRDTRGQGNASALITAKLESGGPNTTNVTVSTELTVTGKVAQFGRGVMADVSGKLMDQFADNLSAIVLVPTTATATPAAPPAPAGPAAQSREAQPEASAPAPSETSGPGDTNGSGASTGTIRKLNLPDPEPIDLMDTAGSSVAKRVLPVIGVGALLLILFRLMRRKG